MSLKRSDIILLTLFLAVAAYVLYVSYFAGTYLTPDSCFYLRQAKALLGGNGFNGDAEAGATTYFSAWPIGYPGLIAAVSFLTGTNVVLASKILSIVILALILVMFKGSVGDSSPVISLAVFNLAFLRIFTYALSEQPFLLGLVWFCFAWRGFSVSPRTSVLRSANLLAAGLFLFSVRYIGALIILVLGFAALAFAVRPVRKGDTRRDSSRFMALLAILGVQVGFIAFYLTQNHIRTGFLLGVPRIRSSEPLSAFFRSWVRAESLEIGVMSVALLIAGIIIGFRGVRALLRIKPALTYFSDTRQPGFYFAFVGILYGLAVVALRWTTQFDEIGYRLLHPSTFLMAIAALAYAVDQQKATVLSRLGKPRIIAAIVVPILAIPLVLPWLKFVRGDAPQFFESYARTERQMVAKYEPIPSGSLVVFGDDAARFFRLDLLFENPRPTPYFLAEPIGAFFERCQALKPDARILLNNGVISDGFYRSTYLLYDNSVFRYLRELDKSDGDFTEIRAGSKGPSS